MINNIYQVCATLAVIGFCLLALVDKLIMSGKPVYLALIALVSTCFISLGSFGLLMLSINGYFK